VAGKITMREIVPLYDTAKKLYHKQIQLEEASRSLVSDFGINVNSMKDYFNCFAAMLEGNVFMSDPNSFSIADRINETIKLTKEEIPRNPLSFFFADL
jgi:hypothetical protein